jgi:DDE superfamily endonuclease
VQRRVGADAVEWRGAAGRVHDQAAVKTEGIADLLGQHPTVKVRVDEGYRGLATAFPEQVAAPPRKPPKDAPAEVVETWKQARTRRSSRRICVERAIAEHKQWRSLQRWIGRRSISVRPTWLSLGGLRPGRPPLS